MGNMTDPFPVLPLPKTGKAAQGVGVITAVTYLFPFRQLLVDKLSINNAGSFCCWGQQPQHKDYLQLIVERNPTNSRSW